MHNSHVKVRLSCAFKTNQTRFFSMLQIIAVSFPNLAIHCLFHPHDLVHKGITVIVEEIEGKLVFVIDDPNEQESVLL